MGKLFCSQDPTQDTKILFNFNIWVGYGLSLDHTGQTKLYKPQHCACKGQNPIEAYKYKRLLPN